MSPQVSEARVDRSRTDAPGDSTPREQPDPTPSYRLATFAILTWAVALTLAAIDEASSLAHAATINAALFLMAVLVIFALLIALQRARAWRRSHALSAQEYSDPVTGLPDHRYLDLRLRQETSRARRYHRPLAVAVIDVNSLDSVNRQYGWTCGDQILRHVGEVLQRRRRSADIVVRLADDHFGIILPECDESGSRAAIERMEQHLAKAPALVEVDGKPFHLWVGISAGVALLGRDDTGHASQLLARAEADLRSAKEERDRRRRLWLAG